MCQRLTEPGYLELTWEEVQYQQTYLLVACNVLVSDCHDCKEVVLCFDQHGCFIRYPAKQLHCSYLGPQPNSVGLLFHLDSAKLV